MTNTAHWSLLSHQFSRRLLTIRESYEIHPHKQEQFTMRFFLFIILPLVAIAAKPVDSAAAASAVASREIEFTVELMEPDDNACTLEDRRLLVFALERALENEGTIWLNQFMHSGGYLDQADIDLPADLSQRMLMHVEDQGERLLPGSFLYGRTACKLCPPDNGDGRRLGQSTMKDMERWINAHLQGHLIKSLDKFTTKGCSYKASQFGGIFEFL
jgi:hypothetical protein